MRRIPKKEHGPAGGARRVLVIHQDEGGAAELLASLKAAGFFPERFGNEAPAALRALRQSPPDAVVIDLSRLPSHGRAVAVALRQQKATRLVPIVFSGGTAEKVAATRALLPDAAYCAPGDLLAALETALASPPSGVVVPDTMQGYSGTPLAKKLGIKAGVKTLLLGAPADFVIPDLPDGSDVQRDQGVEASCILIFIRTTADMERRFREADQLLRKGGRIWFVWPKKSAGGGSLTQQEIREFGLGEGYVDFKVCAVDATWSGLCFVRRGKGDRTGPAGPTASRPPDTHSP